MRNTKRENTKKGIITIERIKEDSTCEGCCFHDKNLGCIIIEDYTYLGNTDIFNCERDYKFVFVNTENKAERE